ncbi:Myb-like_DNA-binding domain-containing protein [Hexamita inflata]|uniref:Myb-like DNA-binding domain-containing protein n=1 Tax=Hexamita inflata TaxID=28002 RepID=A0AA86VS30_9EUKA|nr:Myb-like DNA-binding domain-containing protein [Hexamita inflata]
MNNRTNSTKWTITEKQQLLQLIERYKALDQKPKWAEIQQQMKTKSARQCYDQFIILSKKPSFSNFNHIWTQLEEELLLRLFREDPYNWESIQIEFPEMSVGQLKNKYHFLRKQQSQNKCDKSITLTKQEKNDLAESLKNILGM